MARSRCGMLVYAAARSRENFEAMAPHGSLFLRDGDWKRAGLGHGLRWQGSACAEPYVWDKYGGPARLRFRETDPDIVRVRGLSSLVFAPR
ncbi:MAG: hypothetical protein V3V08_22465 [Nannocystaceae bacterium]